MIADPKRELAESLPLCHPNDDYLKDFTPMQGMFAIIESHRGIRSTMSSFSEIMSNDQQQQPHHHQQQENADNDNKKIPNIKVVHFGVV